MPGEKHTNPVTHRTGSARAAAQDSASTAGREKQAAGRRARRTAGMSELTRRASPAFSQALSAKHSSPRTPPIKSKGGKRSLCHSLPLAASPREPQPLHGGSSGDTPRAPPKPPRPLGWGERDGGSPCPALPGSPELRHRGRGLGAGGAEGGGRRQARHRTAPLRPGRPPRRLLQAAAEGAERRPRPPPLVPVQVPGVQRLKGSRLKARRLLEAGGSPRRSAAPGVCEEVAPGCCASPSLAPALACGSCQPAKSH